jgi:hypothetical protein
VGGKGSFRTENRSLQMSSSDLERVLEQSKNIVEQTRQFQGTQGIVKSVLESHKKYCEHVRKKRESITAKNTDVDDTNDILSAYDQEIECVDRDRGLPDDEGEDMDEADAGRRGEDTPPENLQPSEESFWSETWRRALHEGARRFLVQCLTDDSLPFARRLVKLMEDDEQAKNRVLEEFGVCEDIRRTITTRHLKGEVLELLACYLALARGQCQLRDHRETERVVHINTRVERVFMSGAPVGSPFRLEDGDIVNLMPPDAPNNVRAFAQNMEGHCKRDRFLDVLVVLRDPDNETHPWHFQAIQCKARGSRGSSVSISEYVASLWPLVLEGQRAGCLVSMEWMSNCYEVRQLDPVRGDLSGLQDRGYVRTMMYNDMVAEENSVLEAVGKADEGFGSPLEDLLQPSERHEPPPREFQRVACDETLPQARREGKKYVTVMAATGSGKSRLMTEDGLNAQEEQNHKLPLLATCPSLFLVHQLAVIFALREQRRLRDSGDSERRYYYVVCSDEERVTCPLLRSITNEEALTVMLQHFWEGTLGYCRFFTTVQGSGRLWNKIITFIRVTRGADADLSEPVFVTFLRDEVHSQSGSSDKHWALGLNIPALWCPSYTATPAQEKMSKKKIGEALREADDDDEEDDLTDTETSSSSSDGDDGDDGDDDDDETSSSSNTGNSGDDDEDDEDDDDDNDGEDNKTPSEDFILTCDQRTDRDDLGEIEAVEDKYGLRGLQVLSNSLQFVSVDEAYRFQGEGADTDLANRIREAWRKCGGNLVRMSQKVFKGRDIVIFDVIPEQRRGDCVCGTANASHTPWCPFSNNTDAPERSPEVRGLFRAFVDDDGILEWVRSSTARVKNPKNERVHNSIVLGWHEASQTLCVRRGDARGLAIHDSSSFGWAQGRNFVGPPVVEYTFGEAFQADPQILADPAVAVYTMDPMVLPLDSEDAEDSTGLTMDQIRACMGYEEVTRENRVRFFLGGGCCCKQDESDLLL